MRNILIKYSYDGTDFFGSQRQPNTRTVQGEIEKAIYTVIKEKVNMITAGRTDRGVHALMQVSNFTMENDIPCNKFFYALSNLLPDDILLLDLSEKDPSFHSRFDAKSRSYKYIITDEKSPFTCKYATFVSKKIDCNKLYNIMKVFIGIHDFKNFMLTDKKERNSIREILEINIETVKGNIEINIRGRSFLKSQVRIMIGMAIEVFLNKMSIKDLTNMLNTPNLPYKKVVAPANGLYLSDIEF